MKKQQSLDWEQLKEDAAKERGMALAAAKNADLVVQARAIARLLAKAKPEGITVSDLRAEMHRRGYRNCWGNWMGSIFKSAGWVCAGFTKARHEGSHSRTVRVWRLQ